MNEFLTPVSTTTLSGLAENLTTQIIEAARRLPRRLDLPYPNKNKLAQDPFPALQDWLGEIERTAPSNRFLLCLDEFERLSEVVEATGSRTPLNFLRNMQHTATPRRLDVAVQWLPRADRASRLLERLSD